MSVSWFSLSGLHPSHHRCKTRPISRVRPFAPPRNGRVDPEISTLPLSIHIAAGGAGPAAASSSCCGEGVTSNPSWELEVSSSCLYLLS